MTSNRETYKAAAITIANKICRDAIWQGDKCNWTGLATETTFTGKIVYSRALPPDLYDGVAGIVYFLLQVYRIHPHLVILKTVNGALHQLLASEEEENTLNGFYQGRAGVVFVLKVAAQVLNNDALNVLAEKKLSQLLISATDEEHTDIISGTAGIILFLLYLYRQEKKKRSELLLKAEELGNLLLHKKEDSRQGTSWKTLDTGSRHLAGYAHGAAGIATALAELYAETNNEQLLQVVKEAFCYENSFFNEQQQNWPDLRFSTTTNPEDEICSVTWCHGATGIGLARKRVYEITGDKICYDDMVKALRATEKSFHAAAINDYSLCHGLSGQAFFLLKAASLLNEEGIEDKVYQQAGKCLQQFIHPDIPVPNGYYSLKESPCFMQGNSGVGYFFLHLYNPVLFPSLLDSV